MTIKEFVAKEKELLSQEVAALPRKPHLVIIQANDSPASDAYVRGKIRDCDEVGARATLCLLPPTTEEPFLLEKIAEYNADPDVDGLIVQLPLPKQISEAKVKLAVDPKKDVDGFHPLTSFIPCTPRGIVDYLTDVGFSFQGRNAVVRGRSEIVGKPMAQLMMQKQYGDATVTVCHSRSKTLKEECREADIIIAAIGQPEFVTADMVKEGAVVIDVGTTRVPDATRKSGYRLCGDVKFDEVAPKCSFITPVPGGVGPMTICSLMKNTLAAGKKEYYK